MLVSAIKKGEQTVTGLLTMKRPVEQQKKKQRQSTIVFTKKNKT